MITERQRQNIGLMRYKAVSIVDEYLKDNKNSSRKEAYSFAASKKYEDYLGKEVMFSAYTIGRWYVAYHQKGFDILVPKVRNDHGSFRKIDGDIEEMVRYYKKTYPRISATTIYLKLLEDGIITKKELSLSSVNRLVNIIKNENKRMPSDIERRRYEREHINEVWYGDSSFGPYIKNSEGNKQRVIIIALIDDASRMITGFNIFFNDNYINLLEVIRSGVTKYGVPSLFSFDNGANYRSHQMSLMVARINSSINYCPPFTPQSKSKIERFFRTLKDQWMATLDNDDLKDLESLRQSLTKYINTYNNRIHSSLNNMSPHDRFFKESNLIRRLDNDKLKYAFLLEEDRRVSADNVVVINNKQYEVDYHYNSQKIKIRYTPSLNEVFVVDSLTKELKPLKILNKVENSKIKREKVRLTESE